MKPFIVVLIVVCFLLLVSAYFFNKLSDNSSYGSTASLDDEPIISIEDCPSSAQAVIVENGLNNIRSCTEKILEINDKTVWLVTIGYGQGQDCTSGCSYERLTAIFDGTQSHELPSELSLLTGDSLTSIQNTQFIHSACPYNLAVNAYKETYKWGVHFEGSPGGDAVFLGDSTVNSFNNSLLYRGWDTTTLVINQFTDPDFLLQPSCLDASCSTSTGGGGSSSVFDPLYPRAKTLLNEMNIGTSSLLEDREHTRFDCFDDRVVAYTVLTTNDYLCEYRFNLHFDGTPDQYLGHFKAQAGDIPPSDDAC